MLKTALTGLIALFISDIRFIEYNGKKVGTTFSVPDKFYGNYSGRKKGYLLLNKDGSGEYHYDVFGFTTDDCIAQPISMEWGFIVDESNNIVSFTREYGQSYPILMRSTSDTKFQGCRKEVILDFIMEYKDGTLGVSSSDDWQKSLD